MTTRHERIIFEQVADSRRPEQRISHPEDLMFWDGVQGAIDAYEALANQSNYANCTIKWDGSPSIMFGRNVHGEFIMTDKHGFSAKRYDGRPTSPDNLEKMLLSRKPEVNAERVAYVNRMKALWPQLEAIIPEQYRGFINADVMFFSLNQTSGTFSFFPNAVHYKIKAASPLGKEIAQCQSGIACHHEIDANTELLPTLTAPGERMGSVFVFSPTNVQGAPKVPADKYKQVGAALENNKSFNTVSEYLDIENHRANKISDLGNLMYRYVNQHVAMDPMQFGAGFQKWFSDLPNVADGKKARVLRYIEYHAAGYELTWQIYGSIASYKNAVIDSLEKQNNIPGMNAFTAGQPGGEGFVMDTNEAGQIKLVNRRKFTKANQEKNN